MVVKCRSLLKRFFYFYNSQNFKCLSQVFLTPSFLGDSYFCELIRKEIFALLRPISVKKSERRFEILFCSRSTKCVKCSVMIWPRKFIISVMASFSPTYTERSRKSVTFPASSWTLIISTGILLISSTIDHIRCREHIPLSVTLEKLDTAVWGAFLRMSSKKHYVATIFTSLLFLER